MYRQISYSLLVQEEHASLQSCYHVRILRLKKSIMSVLRALCFVTFKAQKTALRWENA